MSRDGIVILVMSSFFLSCYFRVTLHNFNPACNRFFLSKMLRDIILIIIMQLNLNRDHVT